MPRTGYHQLAERLRSAITAGEYAPGDTLPTLEELMDQYGTTSATTRRAIDVLRNEGLVTPVRRRGTVVRDPHVRRHITRTREVYRDDRGYYFDPSAQGWHALQAPTVEWRPCPRHIAPLLGVQAGDNVLVRDRVMGDPETKQPEQLATSYLPENIARGTILERPNTGSGGIYDRMEEMGHGPLDWYERASGRMPTPEEATALQLPPGVPLLCITRTTTNAASDQVLEVNDTRMSAERFEIGYPLTRSGSADGQ
jgi:DNA-binding GntR family transcriptional regulator